MRITYVKIPKNDPIHDGLEGIEMTRLRDVVILAGKNGSGKSRILDKVDSLLSSKPKENDILRAEGEIERLEPQLNVHQIGLQNARNNDPNSVSVKRRQDEVNRYLRDLEKNHQILNWDYIGTTDNVDPYGMISLVPETLKISDVGSMTYAKRLENANAIERVGVDSLAIGTNARLEWLMQEYVYATHQDSSYTKESIASIVAEYNGLNVLLKDLLGTELALKEGGATLFGRLLKDVRLSKGQVVLLQMCMSLHYTGTKLLGLIIKLDEPENHLHPSAIIEIVKRLQACNRHGQIWIATHSVPLLAHFDPNDIYYVEDGRVEHAGSKTIAVLNSLLGGDEGIDELRNFLNLPAVYASNRFTSQCLLAPGVIDTGVEDPQTGQIREVLRSLKAAPLKVLDFGAGRGRLIANIAEGEGTEGELLKRLDYVAFDLFDTNKEFCLQAIASTYDKPAERYFNARPPLLVKHGRESFHVVVMCNVLHEIPSSEWLKVFSVDGLILSALREDGYLLIVEDQLMSVGEKAHSNGFTVLNELELMDLFMTNPGEIVSVSVGGKGRLKAHLIPRGCVARITEASREKCLDTLSVNAQDEIRKLRALKSPSQRDGQHLAFWLQQYANAELSLKDHRKKK